MQKTGRQGLLTVAIYAFRVLSVLVTVRVNLGLLRKLHGTWYTLCGSLLDAKSLVWCFRVAIMNLIAAV